jgi:hypothetical protein
MLRLQYIFVICLCAALISCSSVVPQNVLDKLFFYENFDEEVDPFQSGKMFKSSDVRYMILKFSLKISNYKSCTGMQRNMLL